MVKLIALLLFFTPVLAQPKQDLFLEAYLETKGEWYPGQEAHVTYRIWYKGEIAIIQEELPLLDISGLEKIGDKVFYEYNEAPFSIQEITQKYRALRPGTFEVGPSLLEGVRYTIEGGQKKPIPPKILTKTPPYSVTITPFPEEGKPKNFNGSIGTGTFEMVPPTTKQTRVGDWITFSILGKGFDEESVLVAPRLDCLPGFAGFFKQHTPIDTSDHTFTFKILPINSLQNEIPPILWTLFNPQTKKYSTFKTDPFPIEIVDQLPVIPIQPIELHLNHDSAPPPPTIPPFQKRAPLEIPWLYLHLALFLSILGYLLLRKPIENAIQRYRQNPLRQAERTVDPLQTAQVMQQLLSEKLQQKGALAHPEAKEKTLSFMTLLEQFQFAKGTPLSKETIMKTGKSLYRTLSVLLLLAVDPLNEQLIQLLQGPTTPANTLATASVLEQLDDPAMALYYLQKGAKSYPYNREIGEHITSLEKQLGVIHVPPSLLAYLTPELVLPLLLLAAFVGFYFLVIHKRKTAYPILLTTYLLLALYYIVPLFSSKSAIVLSPTFLYNTPAQQDKASNIPLIPGDSVEIVGLDNDLFYLYSKPLQSYGYVSQKKVRPLE